MAYADYAFYTETYGGLMSDTDFTNYSLRATNEINALTRNKAKTAPVSMTENLSFCCCYFADAIKTEEAQGSNTAEGTVKSVSNDGYSISYEDGANTRKSVGIKKNKASNTYLTYPVNLIYCGV